jgi:hypothetical protein
MSFRFLTFTFWNYYVLKLLRFETITFSDATLSDINNVLCYVLSQYRLLISAKPQQQPKNHRILPLLINFGTNFFNLILDVPKVGRIIYVCVWPECSNDPPRRPPCTISVHFSDSYPIDVPHLSIFSVCCYSSYICTRMRVVSLRLVPTALWEHTVLQGSVLCQSAKLYLQRLPQWDTLIKKWWCRFLDFHLYIISRLVLCLEQVIVRQNDGWCRSVSKNRKVRRIFTYKYYTKVPSPVLSMLSFPIIIYLNLDLICIPVHISFCIVMYFSTYWPVSREFILDLIIV